MRALRRRGGILASAAAILLAGCSPSVVNLTVPSGGYTIHRDLAYGDGPRRKLDIYVPDGLEAAPPTVLFFYGGNWQSGEKSYYKAFGQSLTEKGIVVAIADYRLFPEVLYPEFLYDAAAALRFVRSNIASYGGDPSRVFVAGHSAGAYNAVMLASDPAYLSREGLDLSAICGAIGIAGPYDFLPLADPSLIEMFGGSERRETQPIEALEGPRPPMLLITGSEDTTVLPRNTAAMATRLRELASPVETITYEGESHLGIILSMIRPFRGRNPLREDIARFITEPPCPPAVVPAAPIR